MSTTAIQLPSRGLLGFYDTTLGKKLVMALTGMVMVGFVVGHMAGNLQIFLGAEAFNKYADMLHSAKGLLYGARAVLLVSVGLHILSAVQLALIAKRARPQNYVKLTSTTSTYASRTMYWSGPILAVFIVYHLLHFTVGAVHPTTPFPGHVQAYQNVVTGFQSVPVALFYIFAMGLLCLHLYHGVWSMLQSLGLAHPQYTPLFKKFAAGLSFVVAIGFSAVPISVLLGIVQ
ncbi:MAG: succinate dehydrogenase cytochrome b subunit [Bryobacterales bacterium]|jgi:succinate dehydrogenase / fumarate reductase cytochrome b subunit|nr:succinate dehydrogenase cytochrome b subunit [Bryobacterales bacterium]